MTESVQGGVNMAKCAICDKGAAFGHHISYSRSQVSRRANRMWKSNVKSKKININGVTKKIYICAGCLRNLKKMSEQ